jgi:uncharacterized membrane protein (DUF4010 family)
MSEHETPLRKHILGLHLWKDILFLLSLWLLVTITPTSHWVYFIIKIMALIATLEFTSFISFHFMSMKKSLLFQGFMGGFVSSTMVFIQLNYDNKFINLSDSTISQALLLAICSMLIECLIIIFSISPTITLPLLLPFLSALFIIIISIFFINKMKIHKNHVTQEIDFLELDDPIVWKKVLKFTAYIAALKYLLLFSRQIIGYPKQLGIFLVSLLESHAVLAVTVSEYTYTPPIQDVLLTMWLILLGSMISKMFFIFRGKVLKSKSYMIFVMSLSLVASALLMLIPGSYW